MLRDGWLFRQPGTQAHSKVLSRFLKGISLSGCTFTSRISISLEWRRAEKLYFFLHIYELGWIQLRKFDRFFFFQTQLKKKKDSFLFCLCLSRITSHQLRWEWYLTVGRSSCWLLLGSSLDSVMDLCDSFSKQFQRLLGFFQL